MLVLEWAWMSLDAADRREKLFPRCHYFDFVGEGSGFRHEANGRVRKLSFMTIACNFKSGCRVSYEQLPKFIIG